VRVIRYSCPVASLTDGDGEPYLVLLDDKTFYQLTSADRITVQPPCWTLFLKFVRQIHGRGM